MRVRRQRLRQLLFRTKRHGLHWVALLQLLRGFQQHARRQISTAITDGRDHADQLNRRDGNLMPDSQVADAGRVPARRRTQQTTRLLGNWMPLRDRIRTLDIGIKSIRPQLNAVSPLRRH